jgi:nucleotide-binding universal stress UspA family protein
VHVDTDTESGGPVRVAAELAGQFDAHLIGICAQAPNDALGRMEQKFRTTVGLDDRRVEWRSFSDYPNEAVARAARAADLLIIGNERQRRHDPSHSAEPVRLVIDAGRPVLVVPPGVSTLSLRHVAVAWKDTREARRAVADALPLLRHAETVMIVEVLEVDDANAQSRLRDVANYLTRHGVKRIAERLRPGDVTAGNALLRMIGDENIEVLVAGAYGHSRFGEWMWGGVTRELLAESPICCLFSR